MIDGKVAPPPANSLDKVIRRLIDLNANYAHERAYAQMTITWQDGEIFMVRDERTYQARAGSLRIPEAKPK